MMYSWTASDYAKNSASQLKWANELIDKLQLKGNEHILDVGCGDGKVTFELAKRVGEGSVIGIDNSNDMIAYATSNFPPEKTPNMQFCQMDALNLTFKNQFDIIFSNACLHWVKDHVRVLRSMYLTLKSNGKILLQMGGEGNAKDIVDIINQIIIEDAWAIFFQHFEFPYGFYGIHEYRAWLEKNGFQAKRVELIPKNMVQQGKEGLMGWLRTTWLPYIERVPPERKQELIELIADRYIQLHPLDNQGQCHVEMVRLEVEAVKTEEINL